MVKPTHSIDIYTIDTRKGEASIADGGKMNNFNVGGRPLFERERFRFENPAPIQYKPDKYSRYDKSTNSFCKKQSFPRQHRLG